MSSSLPVRSKKSKTHSVKPYDRPKDKTIVQTVKSLIPSWLALPTWLIGSDNNVTNIDESENDDDNDSEEDGQIEIGDQGSTFEFDIAGPSGIDSRLLGSTSDLVNRSSALIKDNNDALPSSTSTFTRGPLHRTATASNSKSSSNTPVINGDDQSDNSETSASTSGCSSLAPSHQEKRRACLAGLPISEAALDQIRTELTRKKSLLMSGRRNEEKRTNLSKQTTQNKRDVSVLAEFSENEDNDTPSTQNSLWSEDDHINNISLTSQLTITNTTKRVINSRPQPTGSTKRPCFSTSAFGAPVSASTREALFDGSLGLSPFYDGRTTFGGASAYRRARINSQFPYKMDKTKVNVKEKANSECMSSAAKKILNTLERMSTPLQDAKKIPTESHSTELALSFTPGSYRRKQLRAEHKISKSVTKKILPTSSFAAPTSINIGRNLQPMFQIDKRKEDWSSTKAGNDFPTPSYASSGKAGGKIRATTSQPKHFSSKSHVGDEIIEEPDLPQIPLPISSLPTFNFKLPPNMTSTPMVNNPSLAKTSASLVEPIIPSVLKMPTTQQGGFTFSAPIQPDDLPQNISWSATTSVSSLPKFSFSSPSSLNESSLDKNKKKANEENENFLFETTSSKASLNKMVTEKPDTLKSKENPSSSIIFGGGVKPAASLVIGGSVMDILGAGNKARLTEKSVSEGFAGFTRKFKPALGSWECSVCMTHNNSTDLKCVACERPKSSGTSSNTIKMSTTNLVIGGSVMDILGVGNKAEETSKLTEKSVSKSLASFTQKFKPSIESWECSVCMIHNKSADSKCVACESPKSGGLPMSNTTPISSTSSSGFKGFGNQFKPATGSWECTVCMVNNKVSDSSCAACETPKLGSSFVPKTPSDPVQNQGFAGFVKPPPSSSWECDTCMVRNSDSSITKCQACETPRSGSITNTQNNAIKSSGSFQFGKPSNNSPASTTTFKFGLPISSTMPSSTPSTATSITSGFVFGTVSPTVPATASGSFKFGVPTGPSLTNKTPPATHPSLEKASGFVFGGNFKADTPESDKSSVKASTGSNFVFGSKPMVSASDKPGFAFGGNGSTKSASPTSSKNDNDAFATDKTGGSKTVEKSSANSVFVSSLDSKTFQKNSVSSTSAITNPISTGTGVGGFSFSYGKDPLKKSESGTEIISFGTSSGTVPKISLSTTKSSVNSSAIVFGSTTGAAASENKTDKTKALESKVGAPTAVVTSTSTLPTTGFQFGFGSSASNVEKTNTSTSQSSNLFNFQSEVHPSLTSKSEQTGSTSTASSLFTFGASPAVTTHTTQSSAPNSGFVFGGALNKAITSPTSFNFNPNSINTSTSSQMPVFGSSSQQQAPTVPSLGSSFAFGTNQTIKSPIASVPPVNPSNAIFKFGGASDSSISSQPQQQPSVFSFGTGVGGASGIGTTPRFPSNPTFQFGNPAAQSSDSTVFRFGANQAKMPTSGLPSQGNISTTPATSFGNIGMGTQPPPFGQVGDSGFSFQTGSSTGFNFGTPTASAPLPNTNPQLPFVASVDNPYNGTAGSTANRKIRKAVRRVNKK